MASFEFDLNREYDYLHTRYVGAVTVGDVEEGVVQGNRLYPGVDSLVDFSGASLADLSRQDIESLVKLAVRHEPRNIKCAFVAPRDLEFGMSRMYDILAGADLPQNRRVFRTLRDAQDWFEE